MHLEERKSEWLEMEMGKLNEKGGKNKMNFFPKIMAE